MAKNILHATEYAAMRSRIEGLKPEAERLWGKMDVAQMLAHCCVPLEQATGVVPFVDESNLITRTLIKWVVLRKIKQGRFEKNLPTAKSFVVSNPQEFETQKARLLKNLDLFVEKGKIGALGPHTGFGSLTTQQWGELTRLHLDHHLSQFSA